MKDYNSDSTVVLDRFARDKRKRTTTAERIERRPGPRRDADDTPREHAPRRASYNPHFTEDNRPVDERPRRPSGGSRYGEGRPSGPYRGRPDGPRSDRSGGYGGERSAAEDRPRPYGKKPFGAPKYGDKPAYGRKSAGKFGFKRPYGEQEGDFRHGERAGAPKRYGPKSAGGFKRDDRRGEVRPKSYPRYNPNVQTGEIRLNRFIAQSGHLLAPRGRRLSSQAGRRFGQRQDRHRTGDRRCCRPTKCGSTTSRVQGEKKVYLVLNKPKGYVTSLDDPHAGKTVMELVSGACTERIYPVGRLDKNSLGLLLFTNDGDLTKQLTHPSYKKKKIYQVTLDKPLTRADMDRIAEGVTLEDGEIFADEISYVKENKQEVGIEIHSGRNRIVRRIFEFLGYTVTKLDRVYYAGLTKKNLKRGAWRFLTTRGGGAARSPGSMNSAATEPVSNSSSAHG